MDSESPRGETKRQAGRQIPLVACVIAHGGSSPKKLEQLFVFTSHQTGTQVKCGLLLCTVT